MHLESNLDELILANQITNIDKGTFSSLSNLMQLDLNSILNDLILDNQITNIYLEVTQLLQIFKISWKMFGIQIPDMMSDIK